MTVLYMLVTVCLVLVEENSGWLGIRWSLSDEMDHSILWKKREGDSICVLIQFETESLSYIMGSLIFVRSSLAGTSLK